jgi:hypothetical protein
MDKALNGAKAKVQWAEKHFSDFKDIVYGRSTGIDSRTTTVRHYDLQRPATASPAILAPPAECRLAFGDAVHQLRSSLDHIAYALIHPLTDQPNVLRRVDFPICKSEASFETSNSVSHLRRLLGETSDPFNAIVNAQPYQRSPSAPESDALWILRELDNIDKHRTILVMPSRMLMVVKDSGGESRVIKRPLVANPQGFGVVLPASIEEIRGIAPVLADTGLACDNITARKVWRDLVDAVKATIATFERFL